MTDPDVGGKAVDERRGTPGNQEDLIDVLTERAHTVGAQRRQRLGALHPGEQFERLAPAGDRFEPSSVCSVPRPCGDGDPLGDGVDDDAGRDLDRFLEQGRSDRTVERLEHDEAHRFAHLEVVLDHEPTRPAVLAQWTLRGSSPGT